MTERLTPAELRMLLPPPDEHTECVDLVAWAYLNKHAGFRLSDLLVRIPNGAYHGRDRKAGAVIARKLREEGLQPGTFDYILPVPQSSSVPGLWLEMKRTRGGTTSKDQIEFADRMRSFGWQCDVAKGSREAQGIIEEYLRGIACIPIKNTKTSSSTSCRARSRSGRSK
jgi:hypothetical protein